MITIIDYGLGNLASVGNALGKLEIPYEISSDVDLLKNAKALILPGVGTANQGMENLKAQGIDKIIIQHFKKNTPIMRICLGMQLLLSSSEEGKVDCLRLTEGEVKKFNTNLKVPQIGWNQIKYRRSKINNLFNKIPDNSYFYFVNSYYCDPRNKSLIAATTDYGEKFCSILIKNNIVGVQFHPEKSGDVGLQLLKNFWEVVC
jgi:glutamine amidotransferase